MIQKELKGQGRATNIRGKFRDQAKECKKLMRGRNKIKAENMQLEKTVNRLKGKLIERNGKYSKKKHVTEDGEQVSERGWHACWNCAARNQVQFGTLRIWALATDNPARC